MSRSKSTAHELNQILQQVRSLQRPGRGRNAPNFWIEGVRQFVQAADSGFAFDAILYSPVLSPASLVDMIVRRLKREGKKILEVTPEEFRKISAAPRASGIGAIARKRWTPLEAIEPRRGLCLLIVDELRSPGNLGTILRTAEACGVGGVIFIGSRCDPYDDGAVRASMGGIFPLSLVRASAEKVRAWSTSRGVRIVGLAPRAERLWTELPADEPLAIVVGEERQGISPALRQLCDTNVRLPMTGSADSLNVAIAVGVVLYELVRRTTLPSHPLPQD